MAPPGEPPVIIVSTLYSNLSVLLKPALGRSTPLCPAHAEAGITISEVGKRTLFGTDPYGRICEGFRMTARRDYAAGTGAIVRKPPENEPAGCEARLLPRAMAIC